MALMLLGIGLFGAITATITSYLMTHEMHAVESDEPSATERPTAVESSAYAQRLPRLRTRTAGGIPPGR